MLRKSLFVALSAGMFLSCASSRVQELSQKTSETLELVKKEAQRAIELTMRKMDNYEVDKKIGQQIIENLESAEKQVDAQIAKAEEIEKTGNREEILKFAEQTNVVIQSALTDLKSLNDLYDISTFSQFETATFFPTGDYVIPADKMDDAKKSIEPIVKRMIKFFGEHPRLRFVAVVVCNGFSDETPISTESELYPKLASLVKSDRPTRQEMNTKLSELRARTIATLLVDLIKVNEGLIPNPKLINYDIKWVGRGEALPYPDKVLDYKPDDKRRRMVSLIWNILPGSLYAEGIEKSTAGGE